MPIINPPKKYGSNTLVNMEKKSFHKSYCGPGRYEIDRKIIHKDFRQSFNNSIRKFKLSESVEVYTPNQYDESRSHGMSQFTAMNRTQYSNEDINERGDGAVSITSYKPRRNSTHEIFGPQVTYHLWKGMENTGPGPGKYMMHSDFGQVETQFRSTIPKTVQVGLNPSFLQPLKRQR